MTRIAIRVGVLLTLVGLLSACGGDSGTSPSEQSYMQFRLDGNSCGAILGTLPVTITFFIDGNQAGTESIAAGQITRRFPVSAGSHVTSARVANTDYFWGNSTFTVQRNETFTVVLPC